MSKLALVLLGALAIAACGPAGRGNGGGGGGDFTVYAHSDTVLYSVDLTTKSLVTVGNFNAPNVGGSPDIMTDLAVAPDGTIYTISNTALYTASATDGHVTKVGSLSTCGNQGVALTTTPDGKLWMGDFKGNICQIDISSGTPMVGAPVKMQNGYALSGDFVAVDNGTVFGSAYKLSDPSNQGTQLDNVLVTIDVNTGAVTELGATGYPKLFGVAFQQNEVFGFTHDQTGHVVTMDTASGTGTIYATFKDPSTNKPISFAGAGVSSLVTIGRTAP